MYSLKLISTNNSDMHTGIVFQASGQNAAGVADSQSYLFNCPDYFQRCAKCQSFAFNRVRHVFLSELTPD